MLSPVWPHCGKMSDGINISISTSTLIMVNSAHNGGKSPELAVCHSAARVVFTFTSRRPQSSVTHIHCSSLLLKELVVQLCLATRCGRSTFDLRGCITGTVNHFYCSLTLASPLCASETFSFQQMGKTDITINLT